MRNSLKNKFRIFLLVATIFLIFPLIYAQFGTGSGQEFGLGQTGGGFSDSYASSSVQYSEPGFTGFQAFGYTDPQKNFDICRQRQDFIFQIAPGGCSPPVVRSDLLAEQNVLVLCKLTAIQINPTIDPSKIRNIRFSSTGNVSGYISGFNYLRPRTLLSSSSYSNGRGFGSINNAGYLGFYLRQQPNENAMPDYVSGNVTAFVDYQVQNGFGTGFIEKPIPVLSDEDWKLKYKEYSFMEGIGYLRVEEVRSDKVLVGIYTDVDRKYTSFSVDKGKTSQEVYLPGLYCNSALTVSFIDSVVPKNKAKIFLDDNEIEFYEGDSFGNNCHAGIGSIKIDDNGDSSVLITCNNKKISLSLIKNDINLKIDDVERSAKIGDTLYSSGADDKKENVYLGYSGILKDETSFVLLVSSKKAFSEIKDKVSKFGNEIETKNKDNLVSNEEDGDKIIVLVKDNNFDFLGKKVQFSEFLTTPTGSQGDPTTDIQYNIASTAYNDVHDKFNNVKFPDSSVSGETTYGKKSLLNLFDLSKFVGKNKEASELARKINEEYGQAVSSDGFSLDTDYSGAYNSFELGGSVHTIRLVSIQAPSFEDSGVVVSVDGGRINRQNGDYIIPQTSISGKLQWIKIKDILDDKIIVEGSCVDKDGKVTAIDSSSNSIELLNSKVLCNTNIRVDQINLKKLAKIKINPNNKYVGSVTNISYSIGIEKRAFLLSPEKSLARIKRLNESIDKWQNISDSLAKGIKGMKAACFTTSAALQIKNLFGNLGGKAIARTTVMEKWHKLCDESLAKNGVPLEGMAGNSYMNKDDCFRQNGNFIEEDVNLISTTQKAVSDEIKQREQAGGFVKDSGAFGGGAVDSKAKDAYVTSILKPELEKLTTVIDPNDPEKKKTIDLKELSGDLDSNSLTYEQARDLVTYSRLYSTGNARVKALANDKLYNLAELVNQNKQLDNAKSEATKISSGLGVSGQLEANLPPLQKGSTPGIYRGAMIDKDPVQYIIYQDETGKNTDYIAYLKNTNADKYIIDKAKTITKNSDGSITLGNEFVDEPTLAKIQKQVPQLQKYDAGSFKNPYLKPEVIYHETEPYKGMPAVVPIDLKNGWYAATKNTLPVFGNIKAFQDSGRVQSFWLCNVGANGRQEFNSGIGDDFCGQFNLNTGQSQDEFYGLTDAETKTLVDKARRSLEEVASKYKPGIQSVYVSAVGTTLPVGNPAPSQPGTFCADFMSPKDCQLLFNVCDPVICPSSRCNLGGKYNVDNVVQTGIVGGIFMCLPNYKEGIIIPVCLTGIQAGVDNYVSIMKASRDCLTESVKTGRYVGICDEITAIYKCEFFWRQISPLINVILPKLLERVSGQGGIRGGGEYMNVPAAWNNMQNSIDYFKNIYAINALQSFRVRSTQEVGTPICKSFVSTKFPKKFKALIEPESPPQFMAWFDEIPQTDATNVPRSQYKVYYHIFAGNDVGVQYSIYLKNSVGSSFFQSSGIYVVDTGFVGRGEYVDEARDFVAPSGFKELCVRVNAQEQCGFKQVSTDFALNYLRDKYIQEQATDTKITSEKECISGTPSLYPLINPNLQSGVQEAAVPQIYSRGIIRVCATHNPGVPADSTRWQDVGYCGDQKIRCWIDKNSITDAVSDGHVGAVNKTLDSLGEAAKLLGAEYKGILVDITQENIAFADAETKFTDLKNLPKPARGDEDKRYSSIVAKSKEILDALNSLEENYSLTDEQQARADFMKAQVYDVVTRAAWDAREKSPEPETTGTTTTTPTGTSGGTTPIPNQIKLSDIKYNENYNKDQIWKVMEYAKSNSLVNRKCNCDLNCRLYSSYIYDSSTKNGVDPILVLSIMMQESACVNTDPNSQGFGGLMQLCTEPEGCGKDGSVSFVSGWRDPKTNIEEGVKHLKEKYNAFSHLSCSDTNQCKTNPFNSEFVQICYQGICTYNFKCGSFEENYYGWELAVRGYIGWACSDDEQDKYVKSVRDRYILLNNKVKEQSNILTA